MPNGIHSSTFCDLRVWCPLARGKGCTTSLRAGPGVRPCCGRGPCAVLRPNHKTRQAEALLALHHRALRKYTQRFALILSELFTLVVTTQPRGPRSHDFRGRI